VRPTVLHEKYLSDDYFPCLGSVPKKFTGKNRRSLDINIARFENDSDKSVDRSAWGLPVPNVEAAYISLAKYAKDIPALDTQQTEALNVAMQWCERHFGPYMQNSRVKTQEEVVTNLDLSTSPGFPWTRKYAKKRAMFDNWEGYSQYMADDWERLRDRKYVAVFGNSLKEEIRPRVKIDANSMRTFTAGPVEMTIHGNRLFEDMNQKFYASHLQTASVVGFTPFKGGWDLLYRKLRKHPNGFALDESQYDSSLRAFLMWGCGQFRWNMLRVEDQTPENKERLLNYYSNLINTVVLTSDGVFVRKIGGNPSGSVNTITDNTLILFMLLAYGWIMCVPEELLSYECFMMETSLALCGDDNTWSVSHLALPHFNAERLIAVWAKIGITTTTDSLVPRPVEELDFLSAFTVFVDGIAVPLYSREKILTSLLYSRFPEDPSYTLIRACALLRVGWSDSQLKGYLKELISWLVEEFGVVLRDSEEWRQAMCQIPTEMELRNLFLGDSRPMVKQCLCVLPRDKNSLLDIMNVIALPQRKRKNRRGGGLKKVRMPRLARGFIGPAQRNQRRRAPRRRRVRGGGVRVGDTTGVSSRRNIPDGRRSNGKNTFCEDEEITDLIGSTTFGNGSTASAQIFAVNPGQVGTFPWLSKIAPNYEKYIFTMLEFYYKHEVSEFATAGTVGKAILAFDYDAADPPFTSKQQMLAVKTKGDKMPCQDFVCRIDCRRAFDNGPKYVRPGILPGGADIKTYDIGNLHWAGAGNSDGTTKIGELHVRYEGYFLEPVLESTASAPINNQVSWFQSTSAEAAGATTVAKTMLLATATNNGLGAVNTAGSIVLPPGNYLVDATIDVLNSGAGDIETIVADIQVAGVSVWKVSPPTTNMAASTIQNQFFMDAGHVFVALNGTSALTFVVTVTYSAGVTTNIGSLRITAV